MDWRDGISVLADSAVGFHAQKVEAAAAGAITVTEGTARISALRAASGLAGLVRILDGGSEVWAVGDGEVHIFNTPLRVDTSLVLDFPGAGSAWVVFE